LFLIKKFYLILFLYGNDTCVLKPSGMYKKLHKYTYIWQYFFHPSFVWSSCWISSRLLMGVNVLSISGYFCRTTWESKDTLPELKRYAHSRCIRSFEDPICFIWLRIFELLKIRCQLIFILFLCQKSFAVISKNCPT
jgi:hypothetical protein